MNTPRLVQLETKKAIRQLVKKEDLSSAIQAMCNLKGVGPAMASGEPTRRAMRRPLRVVFAT